MYAYQVLDEFLEVVSGGFSLLLPANNGDHFSIIVSRLLGEDHASSKLVPDLQNDIYTMQV